MADHANDFLNAGFGQAQAVVLGEKFGSLEGRMDRLEQRMTGLEDRMSRLEDRLHSLQLTLMYGLPALFVAQTAALGAFVYYITQAMTGQG